MNSIASYSSLEDFGRVRLSANFFMRDFLHSEIASWNGLRNIPDDPDRAVYAGTQLCENLLEPLQATFGRIHIRSGYRAPSVNDFGNKNQLNCASNKSNYAAHIWDHPDANGRRGATACIVIPWLVDRVENGGQWTEMAWWIHDHLPYSSLCFFSRLAAFNINWHETPERRVDSYALPKGCLISPGTLGHAGLHADQYQGFPSLKSSPSKVVPSGRLETSSESAKQVPQPPIQIRAATQARQVTSQSSAKSSESNAIINYRAVHTKTKWRKVSSHKSLESAIDGVNGATGLFAHKVRIDYEKHGEPLFVLVWEAGSSTGFVLRKDKSQPGGVAKISVPIQKLLNLDERGEVNEDELGALFGT